MSLDVISDRLYFDSGMHYEYVVRTEFGCSGEPRPTVNVYRVYIRIADKHTSGARVFVWRDKWETVIDAPLDDLRCGEFGFTVLSERLDDLKAAFAADRDDLLDEAMRIVEA